MFPDWMLERYLLEELDAANTQRVAAELGSSSELKARLEALEADSRRVLAQHPPELVEKVVARRLGSLERQRRPAWRLATLTVAGLAAVLALVLVPRAAEDDVRLKGGGPALHLFRLGRSGPERLGDAATVRPHDVVQVAFELAGKPQLVVVSVDGAGGATLHFPLDGDAHPPPGFKALPHSFELDDAPGFERFFLVTSEAPLSPQDILEAARRLARGPSPKTSPLTLPPGASASSVRLDKETP